MNVNQAKSMSTPNERQSGSADYSTDVPPEKVNKLPKKKK